MFYTSYRLSLAALLLFTTTLLVYSSDYPILASVLDMSGALDRNRYNPKYTLPQDPPAYVNPPDYSEKDALNAKKNFNDTRNNFGKKINDNQAIPTKTKDDILSKLTKLGMTFNRPHVPYKEQQRAMKKLKKLISDTEKSYPTPSAQQSQLSPEAQPFIPKTTRPLRAAALPFQPKNNN